MALLRDPDGLGLALLAGAEPSDRALTGWKPLSRVLREFGSLLYAAGFRAQDGPRVTAGPVWCCERGHETVLWRGDSACWCCAPQSRGDAA